MILIVVVVDVLLLVPFFGLFEDCSQWLREVPPIGAFGAVRREPVPQCGLLGRRALACPYVSLGRNGDCFD